MHTGQPANTIPELRVVIPARNEELRLPLLIDDLKKQLGVAMQITVVDGNSSDNTTKAAQVFGVEILTSPAGRGRQMNKGWMASSEPWLLFLHADSRLRSPTLVAQALRALQQKPQRTVGHFRLSFDDTPQPKPLFYRHLEAKTALNKTQTFNGDQGLLIHRSFLEKLGGFDERLSFLEDQAISDAIRSAGGAFTTLPGLLHTSARRFECERRAARYFAMMLIMAARECGCEDFIREAPGLYREQSLAGPLSIAPLLATLCAEADRRRGSWSRAAAYLRANAWQAAAYLDSLEEELRGQRGSWLLRYERHLEAHINRVDVADPAVAATLRVVMKFLLPAVL